MDGDLQQLAWRWAQAAALASGVWVGQLSQRTGGPVPPQFQGGGYRTVFVQWILMLKPTDCGSEGG